MRAIRAAAAASLAALALAGCGGGHPAAHVTTRAAVPVTASAGPSVSLTAAQESRECAALDMVRMGYDTYAAQVRAIAGQYATSQQDSQLIIARAIRDECPNLVSVIPAGDPLP